MLTRFLLPAELELYRDHLLRLPETVAPAIDFERAHVRAVFDRQMKVVAAICLYGVGERAAEFTVTIEPAHRGRGLDLDLFRGALAWAPAIGFSSVNLAA